MHSAHLNIKKILCALMAFALMLSFTAVAVPGALASDNDPQDTYTGTVDVKFFIAVYLDAQEYPESLNALESKLGGRYTDGITVNNALNATGISKTGDKIKIDSVADKGETMNQRLVSTPTDEQIAEVCAKYALSKRTSLSYDPEKQKVIWYVAKVEGDGWHVDGVLIPRDMVEPVIPTPPPGPVVDPDPAIPDPGIIAPTDPAEPKVDPSVEPQVDPGTQQDITDPGSVAPEPAVEPQKPAEDKKTTNDEAAPPAPTPAPLAVQSAYAYSVAESTFTLSSQSAEAPALAPNTLTPTMPAPDSSLKTQPTEMEPIEQANTLQAQNETAPAFIDPASTLQSIFGEAATAFGSLGISGVIEPLAEKASALRDAIIGQTMQNIGIVGGAAAVCVMAVSGAAWFVSARRAANAAAKVAAGK